MARRSSNRCATTQRSGAADGEQHEKSSSWSSKHKDDGKKRCHLPWRRCRFADAPNAETGGSVPSPGHAGTQSTEPNQLPVLLVPQAKRRSLQTRGQRNWLDLREEFIRVVTLLQVVVGNEGAQMVDMMKTDIAREPLQDSRQLIERAALQCGFRVIPLVAALPVSPFKLMLYVE